MHKLYPTAFTRLARFQRQADPIAQPGWEDVEEPSDQERADPYVSRFRPFTDQERATLKAWGFRQIPEDPAEARHENWVMQNPHASIITNRNGHPTEIEIYTRQSGDARRFENLAEALNHIMDGPDKRDEENEAWEQHEEDDASSSDQLDP